MKSINVKELSRSQCLSFILKKNSLSSFFNSNVKLTDCHLRSASLFTEDNLRILQTKLMLSQNESFDDIQRILYRLLLNPTLQLQSMIATFRTTHFTKQNVFAIQIRMGGYLSDTAEPMEMMSQSELQALPPVIENAMQSWNFSAGNTVLFISSDSSFAEHYIRQQLGSQYTVVASNTFHRGHTTGVPDGITVKRALIDIFLLSDSDALLYCRNSGFGTIARLMGRAEKIIEYNVTHRLLSGFY